jgi:hypothetical protein
MSETGNTRMCVRERTTRFRLLFGDWRRRGCAQKTQPPIDSSRSERKKTYGFIAKHGSSRKAKF